MQPEEHGEVHRRLVCRLREAGLDFDVLHHEPVFTSAEAAAVRGVSLHSGAKALVVKAGDRFVMIILPANLALDGKALKKELGCKSTRFANKEEVLAITGLEPGAIPPFGSLFGLDSLCDERMGDSSRINFNAGAHDVSISMLYQDYLTVENPSLGSYARAAKP